MGDGNQTRQVMAAAHLIGQGQQPVEHGWHHVQMRDAVLQYRARVDETELRAFLKERLADFKLPKLIRAIDTLPREDSGKVRKRLLRDEWLAELERAR